MSKKLQVFISSTFSDLRDERQAAVEATLMAKHIPAGMELFSAGDASQWHVIQEWISASDVYFLILGARYGSIEPTSGQSYTELEYDFAVRRGMPYFAVVLDDTAVAKKREAGFVTAEEHQHAEKLAAFRVKVLSKSSKIVKDVGGVQLSILQSLHEIEQRPGLVGWVRSDQAVDTGPLLAQLSELSSVRQENSGLRTRLSELEQAKAGPDLSVLDTAVTVTVQHQYKGYATWHEKQYSITWRQLFGLMAMKLLSPQNDEYFNATIGRELGGFDPDKYEPKVRISAGDWETIKAQFLRLGFVDIQYSQTIANNMALFWTLTPLGKQVGIILKSGQQA